METKSWKEIKDTVYGQKEQKDETNWRETLKVLKLVFC